MNVYKMLEIGTDNIKPETMELISDVSYPHLVVYPKSDQHGQYGVFICVPELEIYKDVCNELPLDLRIVLEYAITAGCDWVMVDVDAHAAELPVYT